MAGINYNALLPMLGKQRTEMLLYLAGILGVLYYEMQNYMRYLLADIENIYLLSFSPQQVLSSHPIAVGLIAVAVLTLLGGCVTSR